MSCFKIEGGRALEGRLAVQGAKNSALPILAATLLAPGESVIHNCPRLSDVTATLEILRVLGCVVKQEGSDVSVDASGLNTCHIPEHLMREMRSSVIFLGALLARLGEAEVSYPGGCELGPRPIDLHLSALRALGAQLHESAGEIICHGGKTMQGRQLCLSIPSVGATENIMLAACGCEGVTVLVGAAREPEIVDLQNFLRGMGAQVSGAGSSTVVIQGKRPLHGTEHTVIGDRIAAATFLCAAGASGGKVELTGTDPGYLPGLLDCLREAGCSLHTEKGLVVLEQKGLMQGISPVRTAPYPGFPTDAQAILMAALAGGRGSTVFVENMFDSRYRHVDELRRMGAKIQTEGRVAVVNGVDGLRGAAVRSTDLRGGAALVVAGLSGQGITLVHEVHHIHRGYENLAGSLASLGAGICEMTEAETT